jgi:hypothetical protein
VVVLPLVSTHQARTPSMQLPGTKRAVFPAPARITTSALQPSIAWTWPYSTCRQPAAGPAA